MPANFIKITLAALVGGVLWFVWGAFAHMALGLGESAMKQMPDQEPVLAALRAQNLEDGLYTFPFCGDANESDEAWAAAEVAFKKGPVGMIFFQKSVAEMMPPSTLVLEFIGGLIASFLAAIVIARFAMGPFTAMRAAVLVVLATWFSHSYSEWLWYGYPCSWVMDTLIEQMFGWLLAAGAMARMLNGGQARPAKA